MVPLRAIVWGFRVGEERTRKANVSLSCCVFFFMASSVGLASHPCFFRLDLAVVPAVVMVWCWCYRHTGRLCDALAATTTVVFLLCFMTVFSPMTSHHEHPRRPDIYSYNSAIAACGLGGEALEARALLEVRVYDADISFCFFWPFVHVGGASQDGGPRGSSVNPLPQHALVPCSCCGIYVIGPLLKVSPGLEVVWCACRSAYGSSSSSSLNVSFFLPPPSPRLTSVEVQ